ncbi:metal-dependent hydrolase [Pseudolysinimonas sp.]|uniref:metal-dependent hydrolase n=1 Tax=Pseudolysinimonas sp. TaxID=2680009 RepID=UPI00286B38D8|nr:metal-dependent hydrolase [Pseudolysinimonas sp.]
MISSDTIVDYPAGATSSRGVVLATLPLADGLGVVLDRTAFHAVDAGWPDQPADRGTLAGHRVLDAIVGATDGGEIRIGSDIPVRTGTEGWSFVVVHVLAADTPVAVGDEVEVTVDEGYRQALSAGHTACHLASLALDAALDGAWTKEVPLDTLGAPGFDALACASSRIHEHGSTDVYRVGKSLRRKGFDTTALDNLDALADATNARLAEWVATRAGIRIDRDGDGLGDRRRWVCELPGGEAVIPCGGTHLTSIGELAAVRVALAREDVEGGIAFTMTTTAQA